MHLEYYRMYKYVKTMHKYIRIYLLVYAYRVQKQKGELYVTLRQQNKNLFSYFKYFFVFGRYRVIKKK